MNWLGNITNTVSPVLLTRLLLVIGIGLTASLQAAATARGPSDMMAQPLGNISEKDFQINKYTSPSLGHPEDKDPFGVDFGGPLDKRRGATETPTDSKPKYTLQMAVDALSVQTIMADSKDAIINSYLFHEGDKFNIRRLTEVYTLTLAKVEANQLTFTWSQDATSVVYQAPVEADMFAPADDDPMKMLNQPELIEINLTPVPAIKDKKAPIKK
jgi:hypothetical protein